MSNPKHCPSLKLPSVYFIDEELGLCYVRVPTWCPFRLQVYCNGQN